MPQGDTDETQAPITETAESFTTNVGDYLVIWITGEPDMYIAQVTQSDPLKMKVEESGPYASLKNGDFIILRPETAQLQRDNREDTCTFLQAQQQAGRQVISGLRSLGVTDKELHLMLPA
ncbi:MAG: hypothetical protein UV80_C0002G0242 [Candidatus Peregrinibacteria bacterium GW2011_GWF2_43_17]|nr:MAG: hypothetical protein UV80_C0002G0242 [Candidatus Peregrinibacteria bacterium GW2011_GWF2_43_17]